MELATDYIQNATYPIEMDLIQKKLKEFDLSLDEEIILIGFAIQLNISSINDSINTGNIKKSAQEIANRTSDTELSNKGIPEIPQKYIDQYKQTLESKLQSYFENKQLFDIKLELERIFYFSFAKKLLSQSLYHSNLINNIINGYIGFFIDNIALEFESLIDVPKEEIAITSFISLEIEGIEKLFPYFEHYSQKRILMDSIEIYKNFILHKIQSLLNSSILDSLEKNLVNYAFNLIRQYLNNNQELIDQYSTFILIILEIEPEYLPQLSDWSKMPIRSRLAIYTYTYLIISEELRYIRKNTMDYSFTPSLYSKYHPTSREILRKISSDYPLTPLTDKNIYDKSQFNWFKIIESISITQLTFIPRLKNYSLDLTSILTEKKLHSFPNIPENLKKKRNISLEKLNFCDSSHIVICVSGFLSQEDDHQDQWKSLTKLYPNTSFYSLTWESSSTLQLFLNTIKLFSVNKQFNTCYEEAQIAGTYLAELLMTDGVMMNSCVSLIGFSLGTMVLFQCLDCLSHLNQRLIHDVVFLGSAVPEGLNYKIPYIRESTVSGKMLNIISVHDSILNSLFPIAGKEKAFGTSIIPGMETIDMSDIVNGHSFYRQNLKRIFKKLENF